MRESAQVMNMARGFCALARALNSSSCCGNTSLRKRLKPPTMALSAWSALSGAVRACRGMALRLYGMTHLVLDRRAMAQRIIDLACGQLPAAESHISFMPASDIRGLAGD